MSGREPDQLKDIDRDAVDYNDFLWLAFLTPPALLVGWILGVLKWIAEKFR